MPMQFVANFKGCKNEIFYEKIRYFSFLLKTWIVGTRVNRLNEAVLTSTHNLCFRATIRYKPQFYNIKVACKGVFITRTCLHDVGTRYW